MSSLPARVIGRCLPPMLLCTLDATLTLAGQPAEYWSGKQINEASPTFHHLLAIHPVAFIAGMLVWMGMFVGLILLLSSTLALITSCAVTVGHSYGAASWLYKLTHSYQLGIGLMLIVGTVLALGISVGWQIPKQQGSSLSFMPTVYRRSMIALLLGLTACLFLWR